MDPVPRVGILSTHAVKVRSGAFRAPLEGAVVDILTGLGVGSVALRLISKGANGLGVTRVAAFSNVDVAALNL